MIDANIEYEPAPNVAGTLQDPQKIINHLQGLKQATLVEKEINDNIFPTNIFPAHIREVISSTNESLNYPVDYVGAAILYAASVAIGNTHHAQIMNGYNQSAVLYLAIVGPPGVNKSAPISCILKPIDDRDSAHYKQYILDKRDFDAIAAMSKKERSEQGFVEMEKPFLKQHLLTDFTPEALIQVHAQNKRGVNVYVDELASWFSNFNRYNKGSEEQFWLSAWSGKSLRVNRKSSEPTFIPLPFISVAGSIQPGVLSSLAKGRTENGFLDRLLFVTPSNLKKEYWCEREIDPGIMDNWKIIIDNLLNLQVNENETLDPQPIILRFTPDAKRRIFAWQRELTDLSNGAVSQSIKGIYAKIEMYAIRLSLILEMLRYACDVNNAGNKQAIGIESVEGAILLVEYFKRSAVKVQAIISDNNPLETLPVDKQRLYDALPDEFTTSQGAQIANNLGIPDRTLKRYLKNEEIFINTKRGEYKKNEIIPHGTSGISGTNYTIIRT